jgi:hypothetical protein
MFMNSPSRLQLTYFGSLNKKPGSVEQLTINRSNIKIRLSNVLDIQRQQCFKLIQRNRFTE